MISAAFEARRAAGQAALIPYVTAGFPDLGTTGPALDALADAGADVIELGIPFSDPLADGPTIQRSSFQSLANGTTVRRVLDDLASFRARRDTPVVLFTYLNPLLRYGVEPFLRDAAAAGASGVLLTDLPVGADPELEARVRGSGLDLVRLASPTSPLERIVRIAESGSGFLYYISRTGVTGARAELPPALTEEVARVRAAVSLPVAVGFGVSTPEQAATLAAVADGVVVGSALVEALADGVSEAAGLLAALRSAMDGDRTRAGPRPPPPGLRGAGRP